MVTNRDRKSFGSRISKKFQKLLRRLAPLKFRHFGTHLAESFLLVQIFMNDGPNPLTWHVQLLSGLFRRNPAVFQYYFVNMINNIPGGLCFGSSRRGGNRGGKITTFKLGHPVFDGGVRWCMFPWCLCQNGVNLFRCLALQEKNTWWQLASRCCWNYARRLKCFLSASVTRKDLQFGTWTDPSFQRHYRFRPTASGSMSV